MTPIEVAGAGCVLVLTVAIGTIVHESAHAAVLELSGVAYEFEFLPTRDEREFVDAGSFGAIASVVPRSLPRGIPPWRLRVAAVMPLLLATPLALVLLGLVPERVFTGDVYRTAATLGWLACALPSPQDFSLFWHAEEAIERYAPDAVEA